MIEMPCSRCGREFQLADVLRGQVIQCPDCGTQMRVEEPAYEEEPAAVGANEYDLGITDEPPPEAAPHTGADDFIDDPPAGPAPRVGVDPKRLSVKRLRKRKKRRGQAESVLLEQWNYFTGTFGLFGFGLIGLGVFWLFLLLLTPLAPSISMGIATLGGMLYTVGWWWVVFIAYRDDGMSGTLCLMTGLYAYVYIYSNLEATWRPAGLMVLGILMTVSGYAAGIHLGAIKW